MRNIEGKIIPDVFSGRERRIFFKGKTKNNKSEKN
jgi:hypothetical protein